MASCIIPSKLAEYRKAWKDKDLDMRYLIKMSTEDRTALFSKYAGEDAKKMNALFEEKLVLKNKVAGLKNFFNKTAEEGKYSQEKKDALTKSLSDYRAKQQDRILNPKEHEAFLNDLADEIIGTKVTKEQSKDIWDLSSKTDELFKNYDPKKETWNSDTSASEYGATKVIYNKYVENLKYGNESVQGMLKEWSEEVKNLWKEDKPKAVAKVITDSTRNLTDTLINAVASWDNSFIGRQGGLTLIKSPKTWWKMAEGSIKDIYKTFKGEDPEDVLMASIYSDPDYINGNYAKAKISFGIEEEVPTKLMERLPVAGKIFKAADVAFVDSAIRARRDLFKIMKNTYLNSKTELSDEVLRDIGTVVNSITARGKVGQIGTSRVVRVIMWAPRMLKADWDVLTGHTFGIGLETGFGRVEAAKNIAKVVITTAAIAAIAKAMGAQVEDDPRSSDFLKIKIGDTRINAPFVRGMPQIVTLVSRIAKRSRKTSAGIVDKLNDGKYGKSTIFDVGIDFLANKTTPPVSAVIAWARGRTFSGDKPTVGKMAYGFTPISVQNFIGLKDTPTIQAAVGAFIDLFGFSSNTYSTTDVDWSQKDTKEMQQFKEAVSAKQFKEANAEFNSEYKKWFNNIINNDEYKKLSEDQKRDLMGKKKKQIKEDVFSDNDFIPEREKKEQLPQDLLE